jgi:hypothetical protein
MTAKTLNLRQPLWIALLVVASIAFSFAFTCATPFAAFAAAAALTLPRREAWLPVGAVWLANQIVGFAFLHYPWTADTLAWGLVLGIVPIFATVACQAISCHLHGQAMPVVLVATFLGAFVLYQAGLFAVAATWLGGIEDFTPAIVARIFAINAGAFIGLLVLHRLGTAIGLTHGGDLRPLAAAHRA